MDGKILGWRGFIAFIAERCRRAGGDEGGRE